MWASSLTWLHIIAPVPRIWSLGGDRAAGIFSSFIFFVFIILLLLPVSRFFLLATEYSLLASIRQPELCTQTCRLLVRRNQLKYF